MTSRFRGRRLRRREICLSADLTTAAATTPAPSRWGLFGHLAFTVIWTASLVSNVGSAMFDTASGWLITRLDADPITVSLVQVAVSLPLFLFTLPSGALADIIDSRRLLIAVEVAILAVSVVFAGLVSLNLATPPLLLATTFLLGVGGALTSPAWGATIPMLVPKQDLDSATAEWRCLQHRARRRAGARRVGDRGVGNSHSLLGLRVEQCWDHRGANLVAQSAKRRAELARRASR